MSKQFCKLFESDELGQVLVMLDTDTDECKPYVIFYCNPEGFGVCSKAVKFEDSKEGFDNAKEFFDSVTEERALSVVQTFIKHLDGLANED